MVANMVVVDHPMRKPKPTLETLLPLQEHLNAFPRITIQDPKEQQIVARFKVPNVKPDTTWQGHHATGLPRSNRPGSQLSMEG
jgi:hypothetical protein